MTQSNLQRSFREWTDVVALVAAVSLLAILCFGGAGCGDADLFIAGTRPIPSAIPTDGTPIATETPEP